MSDTILRVLIGIALLGMILLVRNMWKHGDKSIPWGDESENKE